MLIQITKDNFPILLAGISHKDPTFGQQEINFFEDSPELCHIYSTKIVFFFFFFNFILFFKLYIIVLVLPNIKMNPPQVF